MEDLGRFSPPTDWTFNTFTNNQDKFIRYGHVKPKTKSKGTVVMTTGYADFIESYYETIHDYLDRGYEVYMMDWQGQGGSERYNTDKPWLPNPKGFVQNVDDLKQFVDEVVKPNRKKPVFLNTHSMGGHVALHYLHKHQNDFDGAILAAPFIDVHMGPVKKKLVQSFATVMKKLGFGDHRMPGRDRVVKRIKKLREIALKDAPMRKQIHKIYAEKNPNLKIGDPTYSWLTHSFNAAAKLNKENYLKKITTPLLIVGAQKDGMVNNAYARRAVVTVPNAKYVEIEGAYHDLWTERETMRAKLWSHVDKFLKERHQYPDKKSIPYVPKL